MFANTKILINMKKLFTQSALLLAFSMAFVSCSVERNSVSRGGESGYGIVGSGFASSSKSKQVKTMSIEEVAVVEAAPATEASMPEQTAQMPLVNVEKEVKVSSTVLSNVKNNSVFAPATAMKKLAEKVVKKSAAAAAEKKAGGKKWIIAVVLCWLLGWTGAHRYYLGYSNWWLMLITFGGLGIWALIDLVRIIIKDMQPFNGRYED